MADLLSRCSFVASSSGSPSSRSNARSLTGGQRNRRLFLAAPGYGSFAVHKHMTRGRMARRPVGIGEARQGKRVGARVSKAYRPVVR
eukprot:2297339-Pleurochrysis_carterae.AAC.1